MKKQIIIGLIVSIVLLNAFPVWANETELNEAIKHSNDYISAKVNQEEKVKLHAFELTDKSIDETDTGVVVRMFVHVNHDERYSSYSGSLNTLHFTVFINGNYKDIHISTIEETESFVHDENGNYKGTVDQVFLVEHYIDGNEPFNNEYTLAMSWHTQFNDWRYFEDLVPVQFSYSGGEIEEKDQSQDKIKSSEDIDKSLNDEFNVKKDDDERTISFLTLTAGILAGIAGAGLVFSRLRKLRQLRYQSGQRKKAKEGSNKVKELRLKKEAANQIKKALEDKKRGNWVQRIPLNLFNSVKKLGRGATNTVTKLMDIKVASINGNKISLIDAVSFADPTGATKVLKLLKKLNKLDKLNFETLKSKGLDELKLMVIKGLTPGGKIKSILNKISNIQKEYTQVKTVYRDIKTRSAIDSAIKISDGSYRQMAKESQTVSKNIVEFNKKVVKKVNNIVDVNIKVQ
jgi:hypothetical protein